MCRGGGGGRGGKSHKDTQDKTRKTSSYANRKRRRKQGGDLEYVVVFLLRSDMMPDRTDPLENGMRL